MQRVINVGQLEIRYLADRAREGGLGVFEMTVPPGARVPPPHSHRDNEECVYVLDGVLQYSVDGETRLLERGDTMSTPKGSVHAFGNPGASPARVLVMLSPDIGPEYFEEVAAVVNGGVPPDPAKIVAVMARYGLALPAGRAGIERGR
jgi:quercetin dioxygenase-like cupin family protein